MYVSVQQGADPWNPQSHHIVKAEASVTDADAEDVEVCEEDHKLGGLERILFLSTRQVLAGTKKNLPAQSS